MMASRYNCVIKSRITFLQYADVSRTLTPTPLQEPLWQKHVQLMITLSRSHYICLYNQNTTSITLTSHGLEWQRRNSFTYVYSSFNHFLLFTLALLWERFFAYFNTLIVRKNFCIQTKHVHGLPSAMLSLVHSQEWKSFNLVVTVTTLKRMLIFTHWQIMPFFSQV
jgi:hypothetical protein